MTNNILTVGLSGPMLTIRLGERNKINSFFEYILEKLKYKNKDFYDIYYKLYKQYLTISDAENILQNYKLDEKILISKENIEIYKKIIAAVQRLYEQMVFMISNSENEGVLRLIISDVPYYWYDEKQSLEYYDNLKETDMPYWMRQVDES